MEDFFVSYNKADKHWAFGLSDWLDQAGFSTILQEQDFVAGCNFVSEMHQAIKVAKRLIMVLSSDYLSAKFPEAEWTAAFASDPTNEKRTLIPVRVRECTPDGLLRPIVFIDLVGLNAEQARSKFLLEIKATLDGRRSVPVSTQTAMPQSPQPSVNQVATGKNITQVVGDYHHYEKPRTEKKVIQPRPGSISPEQRQQVQTWIETLAEGTVGMSRERAFGMWWKRFKNQFHLDKYEELLVEDLPAAEAWFRQQSAIYVRTLKTKAPDDWRNIRYGAIHRALDRMGVNKLDYYAELAVRLKMKNAFTSLKELTKRDLDRVYNMVLREQRGG